MHFNKQLKLTRVWRVAFFDDERYEHLSENKSEVALQLCHSGERWENLFSLFFSISLILIDIDVTHAANRFFI